MLDFEDKETSNVFWATTLPQPRSRRSSTYSLEVGTRRAGQRTTGTHIYWLIGCVGVGGCQSDPTHQSYPYPPSIQIRSDIGQRSPIFNPGPHTHRSSRSIS